MCGGMTVVVVYQKESIYVFGRQRFPPPSIYTRDKNFHRGEGVLSRQTAAALFDLAMQPRLKEFLPLDY